MRLVDSEDHSSASPRLSQSEAGASLRLEPGPGLRTPPARRSGGDSGLRMSLARQFQSAPPGKLYCITGTDSSVFRLSLSMASHALVRGVPIAIVDGSNRFDAYMIAEAARQITVSSQKRVTPEELLERVFIARAFTCYQMEATITERLPSFLRRVNAPVAMVFGLLDTFYDDQAPLFEVKASLERVIHALHRMKNDNISLLLATQEIRVESKERNALLPRMHAAMDRVYRMDQDLLVG